MRIENLRLLLMCYGGLNIKMIQNKNEDNYKSLW
jgi:hypothetical protein